MQQDILFDIHSGKEGSLGIITLNRPTALNALNYAMIQSLHTQLVKWADDAEIKAIVIRASEGRAFCAGGDIRATYEYIQQKNPSASIFFRDEYQLNRYIFNYPKPYIALLDGITMGGGVGISIHGSHRVATNKLMFAMPETGIGFFPDVGGTYFLPRLPNHAGFYLGLTGARVSSDDCIELGIVQHKVDSAELDHIIAALADTTFSIDAKTSVSNILNQFSLKADGSRLVDEMQNIDQCFSRNSVEEVLIAMDSVNSQLTIKARSAMMTKSPLSMKVTLAALQAGRKLDFDACMQQEFRLANRFIASHDFSEGVRAVIIDKDQFPKWQPNSLGAVSDDMVTDFFEPLAQEEELSF